MFKKSKYGEIIKEVEGKYILVPMIDGGELYEEYFQFLKDGNTIETIDYSPSNYDEKELNKLQYAELRSTDWYVIRRSDTGEEIPQEIIDLRNEIRTRYGNLKR